MDKFGNQGLFNGVPDDAVLAIHVKYTGGLNEIYSFAAVDEIKLIKGGRKVEEIHIAARQPKKQQQWTWEDKKAGRLPDSGSKFITSVGERECIISRDGFIFTVHDNAVEVFNIESAMPIETPEEKANRLREEFVEKVKCDVNHSSLLAEQSFDFGVRMAYDEMQRRNKESS